MRFLMAILMFGALLFPALTAQADILFAPSFTYMKYDTEDQTGSSEDTRTGYDLRLGRFDKGGLLLGVTYSIYDKDSGGSKVTQKSLGPTIGYKYRNGFYGMLTYFLQSEYDSGVGNKLKKGMGPQIDIGWMFNLSETVYLGPTISYRSIKYKEDENGADADTTVTQLTPYVSLWFRF